MTRRHIIIIGVVLSLLLAAWLVIAFITASTNENQRALEEKQQLEKALIDSAIRYDQRAKNLGYIPLSATDIKPFNDWRVVAVDLKAKDTDVTIKSMYVLQESYPGEFTVIVGVGDDKQASALASLQIPQPVINEMAQYTEKSYVMDDEHAD